jgi:hypothetical protein
MVFKNFVAIVINADAVHMAYVSIADNGDVLRLWMVENAAVLHYRHQVVHQPPDNLQTITITPTYPQ